MSMTKRIMERRGGTAYVVTAESEAANKAARSQKIDEIAAVFEVTSKYHHAFVRGKLRGKPSQVYRLLHRHGIPSQSTFYKEVKAAGSLAGYVSHYFFCKMKQSLEELGLPPHEVADLMAKTEDGRRFTLTYCAATRTRQTV